MMERNSAKAHLIGTQARDAVKALRARHELADDEPIGFRLGEDGTGELLAVGDAARARLEEIRLAATSRDRAKVAEIRRRLEALTPRP